MISIYLFTKKKKLTYFLNFKKKNYLHLLYQNNLLQNFNLGTKIILLVFTKMNKFLQFYLLLFQFVFIKEK